MPSLRSMWQMRTRVSVVLQVLIMMVLDAMLYFILTWYIENVHPGK